MKKFITLLFCFLFLSLYSQVDTIRGGSHYMSISELSNKFILGGNVIVVDTLVDGVFDSYFMLRNFSLMIDTNFFDLEVVSEGYPTYIESIWWRSNVVEDSSQVIQVDGRSYYELNSVRWDLFDIAGGKFWYRTWNGYPDFAVIDLGHCRYYYYNVGDFHLDWLFKNIEYRE